MAFEQERYERYHHRHRHIDNALTYHRAQGRRKRSSIGIGNVIASPDLSKTGKDKIKTIVAKHRDRHVVDRWIDSKRAYLQTPSQSSHNMTQQTDKQRYGNPRPRDTLVDYLIDLFKIDLAHQKPEDSHSKQEREDNLHYLLKIS